MKLSEAARQVCALIQEDIERFNLAQLLDPSSPDGDPAKFTIDSRHDVNHFRDINLNHFNVSLIEQVI